MIKSEQTLVAIVDCMFSTLNKAFPLVEKTEENVANWKKIPGKYLSPKKLNNE